MVDPEAGRDLHLALPLGISLALRFRPRLVTALATDALDIVWGGPVGGAQRHPTAPTEGVTARFQPVADGDPLIKDETLPLPQAFGRSRRARPSRSNQSGKSRKLRVFGWIAPAKAPIAPS